MNEGPIAKAKILTKTVQVLLQSPIDVTDLDYPANYIIKKGYPEENNGY